MIQSSNFKFLDNDGNEFDPNQIVDMTSEVAAILLESFGFTLRIVRFAGNDLIVTRDFNPKRINVSVDDGSRIFSITGIG